jgi:hypothetical protein
MGCTPAWGLGMEVQLTLKNKLVTKCHKGPRTWTDSLDKRSKLRKMDVGFDTWNVRRQHREGSPMAVAKKISKYKLDLVGVQDEMGRACSTKGREEQCI